MRGNHSPILVQIRRNLGHKNASLKFLNLQRLHTNLETDLRFWRSGFWPLGAEKNGPSFPIFRTNVLSCNFLPDFFPYRPGASPDAKKYFSVPAPLGGPGAQKLGATPWVRRAPGVHTSHHMGPVFAFYRGGGCREVSSAVKLLPPSQNFRLQIPVRTLETLRREGLCSN